MMATLGQPPTTWFFDVLNLLPKQRKQEWWEQSWCLQQTHGEPWRHDLGPLLSYPWRERAKPLDLEGRMAAAHFVVVCLLCLLCVCCDVYVANQLVETSSGTCQNGRHLCNHDIEIPPNMTCSVSSWFEETLHALPFWLKCNFGCFITAQKMWSGRVRFS